MFFLKRRSRSKLVAISPTIFRDGSFGFYFFWREELCGHVTARITRAVWSRRLSPGAILLVFLATACEQAAT